METWKNASSGDLKRYRACSMALDQHPALLRFLFRTDRAELNAPPEEVERRAHAFSAGEQILIQIALDFWSDSGEVQLMDIMRLDPQNCKNVLVGLSYRYAI